MRLRPVATAVALFLAGSLFAPSLLFGLQQGAAGAADPELATTVDDGFTIAVVGDVILAYSLAHEMSDPGFGEVVGILRSADVATGNLEGNIVDGRVLQTSAPGGFGGEPSAADWLVEMGFDIMARPNNHSTDFWIEGVNETSRQLDRVGMQYTGVGNSYAAARAARYYTSARGRVGMVATFARDGANQIDAAPGGGEWLGRGGISALRVGRSFMVPEDRWGAIQTLRDDFPSGTGFYARGANSDTQISLIGNAFRKAPPGTTEPHFSFQMNQGDFDDLVAAVREGKLRSDFVSFAIHSHHFHDTRGGYRGDGVAEAEHLDTNSSIPDFHIELAHAVIDAGADLYQGTGVHALRGIEIYRNRPIFYGLGEFIRQMDVIGIAGRGDPTRDQCVGCPFPVKYESVIAVSTFEGGELAEVRLHPVELGYEEPRLAKRGIPRPASPETARRILERLQDLSSPFGTQIAIEGNVGVIRSRSAP
ncbi:MAG: CapA family protein [Gemmatimonadota bacterium]